MESVAIPQVGKDNGAHASSELYNAFLFPLIIIVKGSSSHIENKKELSEKSPGL